ncbi:signal peptidase I [Cryobacterium tepidiphilum]|uniref:signal peptidase I n=1 Tax=Cryobacterium tepidiphilum TaxID=2486026 RepID=UPI00131491C9|nr:signal peptidase I [Cryobacterium tepidiphilum]
MIRLARLFKETALTVTAVVGAVCIAGFVANMFFGITLLVFRSGSMAPAIHTGALALAQQVPAADVHVGDVVSAHNAQGALITHRVVAIESAGGGTYAMTMRGDANDVADPTDYLVSSVDRIVWHIDDLGYLVPWAQQPFVVFLGGALVGAIVVSSVIRRSPRREPRDAGGPDTPANGSPSAVASRSRSLPAATTLLGVVVAVPLLATLLPPVRATYAAFTDTATASTSFRTLTEAQLRPVLDGCSVTADRLTVTWSDPTGAVPDRGYSVQSANSSAHIPADSSPYSWSTPLVADDLVTITAQHFASWSASIGVRVTTATDGSTTCSEV